MNKQYASSVGGFGVGFLSVLFSVVVILCAFYIFLIEDEGAWRLHLDVSPWLSRTRIAPIE